VVGVVSVGIVWLAAGAVGSGPASWALSDPQPEARNARARGMRRSRIIMAGILRGSRNLLRAAS
jgi:hypothetical protein